MVDASDKTSSRKIDVFPSSITFLVLEDMDNLREQMVRDLRKLGVSGTIHEAPNVQTALKLASSENIGFIISDWNLPDGTGNEFLKKLRSVDRYKKTPFIICTTNSEIKFFLEAVQNGASDYIVKPWQIDELKKKIQLTWEVFLTKSKVK